MHDRTAPGAAEKRDRAVLLAGIVGISALAWACLVHLTGRMDPGEMESAMLRMQTWDVRALAFLFAMWVVMMVAMMVPSAAPVVLLFAEIHRRRRQGSDAVLPTAVFLLGYLLVWTGYSALAASVQWRLHAAALLSPTLAAASPVAGGLLLVTAGIFQWMPPKRACLVRCRSPLGFLTSEWREGARGILRMGLKHGSYCLGCCWILMALLFVAGMMNLLWVAMIAAFVMVEKIASRGDSVGRVVGGMLVLAGIALLTVS